MQPIFQFGARGRNRTGTSVTARGILSFITARNYRILSVNIIWNQTLYLDMSMALERYVHHTQ